MNPSAIATKEDIDGLENRLFTRLSTMLQEKPEVKDILSKAETLQMLGITHNTLRKLTLSGKLPGVLVSNKMLYRRVDVEAYLKTNTTV